MFSEVARVLAWPLSGLGRSLCFLEPLVPLWDGEWFLAQDKWRQAWENALPRSGASMRRINGFLTCSWGLG